MIYRILSSNWFVILPILASLWILNTVILKQGDLMISFALIGLLALIWVAFIKARAAGRRHVSRATRHEATTEGKASPGSTPIKNH